MPWRGNSTIHNTPSKGGKSERCEPWKLRVNDDRFFTVVGQIMPMHVWWSARDLLSLLTAVPKGSIGVQRVSQEPGDGAFLRQFRIPDTFIENNVQIMGWDFRRMISQNDCVYLENPHNARHIKHLHYDFDFRLSLNCAGANRVRIMKAVEGMSNLETLECRSDNTERKNADFNRLFCQLPKHLKSLRFAGSTSANYVLPRYVFSFPAALMHLEFISCNIRDGFDISMCANLVFLKLYNVRMNFGNLVVPDSVSDIHITSCRSTTLGSLQCGSGTRNICISHTHNSFGKISFLRSTSLEKVAFVMSNNIKQIECAANMPNFTKGHIWIMDKADCQVTWGYEGDADWAFGLFYRDEDIDTLWSMFDRFSTIINHESPTVCTRLYQTLEQLGVQDGHSLDDFEVMELKKNLEKFSGSPRDAKPKFLDFGFKLSFKI